MTLHDITLLNAKAKGLHVLYVEDEEILRDKISYFLKKIFTYIDLAVDGKEGLEKYTTSEYDIVITDMEMPKMNGIELINNIHKQNKEQEIIITSAHTEGEYSEQNFAYTNVSFIRKPIDINKMIDIINNSIDRIKLLSANP